MVNEQTIKETLTLLKLTYPNAFKDMTKEEALLMIKIWTNDFKDTKVEDFSKAINRLRYSNKFCPSIAEIKSEIALVNNKTLQLNPEEEWEKILKVVRTTGNLSNAEFDEITKDTIRALGQYRLEMIETTQIPFMKKEFIDIWESKRDGIEHYNIQNKNTLTYKEQLMLEQQELDKEYLMLESEI